MEARRPPSADVWRDVVLKGILNRLRSPVPGYELIEPIDSGAFSTVHRARRTSDGLLVALKILNEEGRKVARKLKKKKKGVMWEGELMSKLSHRHIVEVIEYGDEKKPRYIVMELLENRTAQLIHACKSWGEAQRKADITVQVGRALEHVHNHGYLHRDLCAGNILVNEEGEAKLIDFGLAAPAEAKLVQDWRAGTPSYMAPELIRTGQSSCQTDIYSLGVILYELVAGVKPVKTDYQLERMMQNLGTPIVPPSRHCEHVSPALDAVIVKAIAKEPEQRYPNMKEFLHGLVTVAIGVEPQLTILPATLPDGQVIETDEHSIEAWAYSPIGIQTVEFQFRLADKKWRRISNRVESRPGRENIFGVDWDASGLPEGAKVRVRAVALDQADQALSSEAVTVVVGKIVKQ